MDDSGEEGGAYYSQDDVSTSYELRGGRRGKRGDSNMQEIIRFVREFQRQPTSIRMAHRAPLPEIGAHPLPPASLHREDPEIDESSGPCAVDGSGAYDDLEDREVAAIDDHFSPLRREPGLTSESLSVSRAERRRKSSQGSVSGSGALLSSSSKWDPVSVHASSRHHQGLGRHNHHSLRPAYPRNKSMQLLPPIERSDLPDRPSAPSPTLTPPPLGEELDSAGEPVDFIDSA